MWLLGLNNIFYQPSCVLNCCRLHPLILPRPCCAMSHLLHIPIRPLTSSPRFYTRLVARLVSTQAPMASSSTSFPSWKDLFCGIDAEPLHRYRQGGYHPTHLGDTFKNGRYKIMHKLGWGSYGTVWLAKDQLYSSQPTSRARDKVILS